VKAGRWAAVEHKEQLGSSFTPPQFAGVFYINIILFAFSIHTKVGYTGSAISDKFKNIFGLPVRASRGYIRLVRTVSAGASKGRWLEEKSRAGAYSTNGGGF
jgi:hypothetical protein